MKLCFVIAVLIMLNGILCKNVEIQNVRTTNEILIRSNILYGLLKLSFNESLNIICQEDLEMIYKGINEREIWALRAFDASANVESGYIWGNKFWLGSRQICETFQIPHPILMSDQLPRQNPHLANETSPINISYRIVYLNYSNFWQIQPEFSRSNILHIGLCIPTSCSNDEIGNLTQTYFNMNLLELANIFEMKPKVNMVKDLSVKTNYLKLSSTRYLIAFLVFTLVMIIFAWKDDSNQHAKDATYQLKEETLMDQIIRCFSIQDNLRRVMNPNVNFFPTISFLRVFASVNIIVYHLNHFGLHATRNESIFYAYLEQFRLPWSMVTLFIVDLYYVISAFILSYSLLGDIEHFETIRKGSFFSNAKHLGVQIFRRYLRFTPLLFVVIAMTVTVQHYYADTSTFFLSTTSDEKTCPKFWWRNAIYIQNWWPRNEYCLLWSWSLANDMQYYIFFSVLLFIYAKNEKFGKVLFAMLFIAFFILIFILSLYAHYSLAFDISYEFGDIFYFRPYTRILGYFVGIFAGWISIRINGKLSINQNWMIILWISITLIAFLLPNFGVIPRWIISSEFQGACMMTIYRVMYCSALSFLIIVLNCGYGGWFLQFTKWKIFAQLSQISYAYYLLNPLLIRMVASSSYSTINIESVNTIIMAAGIFLITNIVSLPLTLLFDIPYYRIGCLINKRFKTKKKVN